jgi:hypothetical protein
VKGQKEVLEITMHIGMAELLALHCRWQVDS